MQTICQQFTLFRCEGAVITSSTYSSHIALHTSLTTIERVFLATRQEYCMSEYLAPESRWRRVSANLSLGAKGFLFQVCCFQKRLRTFSIRMQMIFGWFQNLLFELNIDQIIDAKSAHFSGCSFGLLNMRRTLAPLPYLSRPLGK